jgi:hypothetical protein
MFLEPRDSENDGVAFQASNIESEIFRMILDLDLRRSFSRDDVGLAVSHLEEIARGLGLGQGLFKEETKISITDEIAGCSRIYHSIRYYPSFSIPNFHFNDNVNSRMVTRDIRDVALLSGGFGGIHRRHSKKRQAGRRK